MSSQLLLGVGRGYALLKQDQFMFIEAAYILLDVQALDYTLALRWFPESRSWLRVFVFVDASARMSCCIQSKSFLPAL